MSTISQCWRYPVKSMQGERVAQLTVGEQGVVADRRFALIDESTGHVMSGKRFSALMLAETTDEAIVLPDGGPTVRYDDPAASTLLSDWLGRPVRLARPDPAVPTEYEMTFDPPNDDAEYFTIPTPTGSFVDLAHVHLVTTATLEGCRAARPDLDWDVRRFRPNLVVDVDAPTFVEDGWAGSTVAVGDEVVLEVLMPTVRCAMPLRAQPGLGAQPELFKAMSELNEAMPNHLGVYCTVQRTGVVAEGDAVSVSEPGG
jgi:uncharacterized protein YcbX